MKWEYEIEFIKKKKKKEYKWEDDENLENEMGFVQSNKWKIVAKICDAFSFFQ